MAEAIQRIVPEAQLVYGPPLEDKFYYDIKFPDNRPLKDSDFPAIEAEMKKIIGEDRPFTRYELEPVPDSLFAAKAGPGAFVGPGFGLPKLQKEKNKYKIDNACRARCVPAKWAAPLKPELSPFRLALEATTFPPDRKSRFQRAPSFFVLRHRGSQGENFGRPLRRGPHASPAPAASAPSKSCRSPAPTGTAMRTPTASPASTAPPSPRKPTSTSSSSRKKRPSAATIASSARPCGFSI